ncbi:MAG: hypothetical protein IIA72_22665 [Proteobacteria bacterium]|nr:hypothetical protein [Pseudomonadota bacterium]
MLAGPVPVPGAGDLRPGAPEWPRAVDDHYASIAEILGLMEPDERVLFEDDYAQATGVLPEPILKQMRGGLLSTDPAAQAAAAQRLARLKDGNPALVSAIPADERARAQAIAEFADLGLQPDRAVELAEEKLAQGGLPSEDLIRGDDGDTPEGSQGVVDGFGSNGDATGSDDDTIEQLAQRQVDGNEPPAPLPKSGPLTLSPTERRRARAGIATLRAQGAGTLPHEEKVLILKHLGTKKTFSRRDREVVRSIYANLPPDKAFEKHQAPKRRALLGRLSNDGTVQAAIRDWPRMTDAQRLNALERALDIHAAVFGIERPKLVPKQLKETGLNARYDEKDDTIFVNPEKFDSFLRLGGHSFETVIHEAMHAYQWKLVKDYWFGRLKPDDPRFRQAELFTLNRGQLQFRAQEGKREYENQPAEKHARAVGKLVKETLEPMPR